MTDYRDDWKYSKPIPRVEADKRYRENWDRVFKKDIGAPFSIERDENGDKYIAIRKEPSDD